jgi:signal transduction histidine kinase
LAARAVWRYRLVDITPAFAASEIINAMADVLLVLDNEGIVRVANGAACQLFDTADKQLAGRHIHTLTPTLADADLALDRLILAGRLREFESNLPATRGGITTVSTSSFAMCDAENRPIAFVCIIRHTERQTALYEIHLATTSTLELHAVLNVLLEKLTALVPQSATTILLLAGNERELIKVAARGIDEEAWEAHRAESGTRFLHPVLETREAISLPDIQADSIGPDSEYFRRNGFVSYLGLPLIAQDRVLGILSFYCRQKRHFDDEEMHFLSTLAGQAAAAIENSQLYEQTRKQAVDLEKANKVKDEFLGVMSHELRTPLNVIAGYTKIVHDGLLGAINAEQITALEKVTRHSNELLLMVNSIMDATKIEAGAVVVEYDDLPLSEFLDELKLLYDYPLAKSVSLQWHYPPDLPMIRTDRDKLKHILQNLLNNSLKFTETGRITLSGRHLPQDNQIEIAVSDTGIGIATEDLNSVFEKFRQLDSSRTRTQGGVGLGLHIVKTFVEILGGKVTVRSRLREGSTFTVTLPCGYEGASTTQAYPRRREAETKL